ncbi:hypothetical protein EZJ19_03235 [Parasulfuritortus cantonensis]|uniref:Alpha-L-arabinofuranosidase C-terminal domain-containing protein n=1 Tax=Parasulfuritortus cantonensis TaxID=2528202 RepID=A0A4R1BKW2_9PROT|nr:hypothetical protein [Parasulfuritortus cantonensis]TCJ17937.1 hypothetical protein EZJ19_03235 [Parasulfuritortus cantonensis]
MNIYHLRFLTAAVSFVLVQGCAADSLPTDQLIEVQASTDAVINVFPTILRRLPDHFLGLNFESQIFESDALEAGSSQLKPGLLRQYQVLPGLVYRYPGGLMANHFNWEWAMGPAIYRTPQKLADWAAPVPARFGAEEYLSFLNDVNGRFWYTLNLNGWSTTSMDAELPSATVAASNGRLAAFIRDQAPSGPRYYQLGNELDRNEYEWPTSKYIERASDTIAAMSQADPDAKFVAFLRDFNLTYQKSSGKSPYKTFNQAVLDALPMVNDLSFQYYYDDLRSELLLRSSIPWRLKMFQAAIRDATAARQGRAPNVWITEHGRSRNPDITGRLANTFTSGLAGALSAADFWIATAQMPAIQGAFLYSVGQWSIFNNAGSGVQPLPMYWVLRLLNDNRLPNVLATQTNSPNESGYIGGYDVRAVALADDTFANLGLWVVNRAAQPHEINVELPVFGGQKVSVRHDFIAGRVGVAADQDRQTPGVFFRQPARTVTVGADGVLVVGVPANSVSCFRISLAN